MLPSTIERRKIHRTDKQKLGLCRSCQRPRASKDHSRCDRCLAKRRINRLRQRDAARAAGKCATCRRSCVGVCVTTSNYYYNAKVRRITSGRCVNCGETLLTEKCAKCARRRAGLKAGIVYHPTCRCGAERESGLCVEGCDNDAAGRNS